MYAHKSALTAVLFKSKFRKNKKTLPEISLRNLGSAIN